MGHSFRQCQDEVRRRQWHLTPVPLLGKSHGRRSLVGCSPWDRKESDTTERLHFHFSLSCIGEGNGNPLQCSCLENPRDGGAWQAAVYGVAQSRTRLKRLSSSRTRMRWPLNNGMSEGRERDKQISKRSHSRQRGKVARPQSVIHTMKYYTSIKMNELQ